MKTPSAPNQQVQHAPARPAYPDPGGGSVTRRTEEWERKYEGGIEVFNRILARLRDTGFTNDEPVSARRHFSYFEVGPGELEQHGMTFRRVTAPEGWVRYDLKTGGLGAEHRTELSIRLDCFERASSPEAERAAILARLLSETGSTMRYGLALLETISVEVSYRKVVSRGQDLEVEVSLDRVKVATGLEFEEVEVELLRGAPDAFVALLGRLEADAPLVRVSSSKLERARKS